MAHNGSQGVPEFPDLLQRQDSDTSWHPSQEEREEESDTDIHKNQIFMVGLGDLMSSFTEVK